MKTEFQQVMQKLDFLSPHHVGQLDVVINYMQDNNILLDFNITPHMPTSRVEIITKNIHLSRYAYPENYIPYELTNELLEDFYKLIDKEASTYDLSAINILPEEEFSTSAAKLRAYIISLLNQVSRYDAFNMMIISPSLLAYIYHMGEFYSKRGSDIYDSTEFEYNRFRKIGTLFNRISIYVDNYKKDDFIILGQSNPEILKLFYSWNHCNYNQICYTLETVCHDFKDKFFIFKYLQQTDPMEINATHLNAKSFFPV